MVYTLITGGAGYIGSHICFELYKINKNIIVIDNFSTSKESVKETISKVCPNIEFYSFNIGDKILLTNVFSKYNITNVIHLASYKSISDSINYPIEYYKNNISETISLLEVMKLHKCTNMVFSSSATVYGHQDQVPIKETAVTYNKQTSPYGKSKLIIEMMLEDLCHEKSNWNIVILRYFNPVAADTSGLIGEDPKEQPSNLFPHILNVYQGKNEKLTIFGNDYRTIDGTCIRDFIHVSDLAQAHISAIDFIENNSKVYEIFNIGTGEWNTVLQIVNKFNELSGNKIPYIFGDRRIGDIDFCFANCSKANDLLKWKATKKLDDMVRDSINRVNYLNSINNS
jgi:UDP-glucose 4-epimerase